MAEISNGRELTRRDFMIATAAATAALGLAGCSQGEGENELSETQGPEEAYYSEEEWIPAACWIDCGGRCPLRAQVKDGTIVRVKGDDTHEDSEAYPQQRCCARGRSQRHHILAADRLKYPMRRKHWLPDGAGDNTLRGRDEWERISWDEATELIAHEIDRVLRDYGNDSVLVTDSLQTEPHVLMNKLGGCATMYMVASYGSWQNGALPIGTGYATTTTCLDRLELKKADTVILWGVNPAWSSGGNPSWYLRHIKEAGTEIVAIDPFFNDSYAMAGAEWVPVRPGTDIALMMGMLHHLLERDTAGESVIDWDFVHTYTVGFDAECMPEGADPDENLKDYVLGRYDNVPKTPEWASEICGVEPDRIRALTEKLALDKNVALLTGYAPARTFNTDHWPQMFLALGAATGHIGKSGNMTGIGNFQYALNGGPLIVDNGMAYPDLYSSHSSIFNWPAAGSPQAMEDQIVVDSKELWRNAIPNKKLNDYGNLLFNMVSPVVERDVDFRIIWSAYCNIVNCNPDPLQAIKSLREGDVDLIIRQDINFTPTAQYADIVLPVITPWERPGGMPEFAYHGREAVIYYFQVMEPLYEAKDDQWIIKQVAEKLGVGDDVFPVGREAQEFVHLCTSTIAAPDGTVSPLVTITQEDIDSYDLSDLEAYVAKVGEAYDASDLDAVPPFEIKTQEGQISVAELKKSGVFSVKREEGDGYAFIPMKDFVDDPEGHPLDTATGKIEIYSQALADMINGMGYSTIKPYPTYEVPLQGYEATFADWKSKTKGEFPYQVINPHYMGRQHSTMNNVDWLREAFDNPVYINIDAAAAEGIQDGDTVLLTAKSGRSIRRACVTRRLIPGTLAMPHGAWLAYDEEAAVDRGGHDNVLAPIESTSQSVDAYNSTLVNIRVYDGEPLPSHVEEPVAMAPVE